MSKFYAKFLKATSSNAKKVQSDDATSMVKSAQQPGGGGPSRRMQVCSARCSQLTPLLTLSVFLIFPVPFASLFIWVFSTLLILFLFLCAVIRVDLQRIG